MTTPTIDALWKGYQIGQGSADHTAKEVFAEVIGPVLRDLVAAQEELKEAQEKLAAARAGIAQLKADLAARDAELAAMKQRAEAAEMRLKLYEPIHTFNGLTIEEWKRKAEAAERDAFTMAAGQCIVKSGGLMADDHGHQYCDMERQRDEWKR